MTRSMYCNMQSSWKTSLINATFVCCSIVPSPLWTVSVLPLYAAQREYLHLSPPHSLVQLLDHFTHKYLQDTARHCHLSKINLRLLWTDLWLNACLRKSVAVQAPKLRSVLKICGPTKLPTNFSTDLSKRPTRWCSGAQMHSLRATAMQAS